MNVLVLGKNDDSSMSSFVDIYVSCVSYSHNIAAKGFFVASVSTYVETANPERELQPGIDLLGPVLEKLVPVMNFTHAFRHIYRTSCEMINVCKFITCI